MSTSPAPAAAGHQLQRNVGYFGLMFVSLGCIIGSGWLMGALNVAKMAGPASLISWVLGVIMLSVIALVYSELGTSYPVAGGAGRYAGYSHGSIVGFASGWATYLATVFIAPIEILAALAYVNSVDWVNENHPIIHTSGASKGLLNREGLILAVVLMVLFTAVNLAGAKFMSDSNTGVVIWKTAVPLLAIGVIAFSSFHTGNFTDGKGGFMPHGMNGVFMGLAGGVVFALQGFEQAVQLAGEARNPRKDMSRAIITAMVIGGLLYTILEVVFIAGVTPSKIANGWDEPLKAGDYGAYYTLALGIGVTWLAVVLVIDAVISPAGTGVIYVGTSARQTYALAAEKGLPDWFRRTNDRHVPVNSIIFSAVIGTLAFGPFKSWNELVAVITGATAIMYSFAPLALAALKKNDLTVRGSYKVPVPSVLLPVAFIFTNLIVFWGGFDGTWKLAIAVVLGLALYMVNVARGEGFARADFRGAAWIPVWLLGHVVLGYLGNYGTSASGIIPNGWDVAAVALFSLAIYAWALRLAQDPQAVEAAIDLDRHQLSSLEELEPAPL